MIRKKLLNMLCILMVSVMGCMLTAGCGESADVTKESSSDIGDQEENSVKEENTPEKEGTESETVKPTEEEQAREITVYYIDMETAEVVGKQVSVQNEFDIWEELQKSGTLTEECKLNSMVIDDAAKTIDLDFNRGTGDWIRSMGTNGEVQITGCIINTYLQAYQCEGIKLLEEGKPLETSHGANFDGYSGKMSF